MKSVFLLIALILGPVALVLFMKFGMRTGLSQQFIAQADAANLESRNWQVVSIRQTWLGGKCFEVRELGQKQSRFLTIQRSHFQKQSFDRLKEGSVVRFLLARDCMDTTCDDAGSFLKRAIR